MTIFIINIFLILKAIMCLNPYIQMIIIIIKIQLIILNFFYQIQKTI